jgi:hypothetical protein
MNVFALWRACWTGRKWRRSVESSLSLARPAIRSLTATKKSGLEALTDRSRRPWRYGNQLPQQVQAAILNLKREKPYWGARKIRERLLRRFSCEVKVPARSTIHAVLDRHGLVQRRGRKRNHAQGTPLSLGQKPNELWCTDYKGEFLLGNKKYCYPLTPRRSRSSGHNSSLGNLAGAMAWVRALLVQKRPCQGEKCSNDVNVSGRTAAPTYST